MQKSQAFEAGDKKFQGYFVWCSSIGLHMGQQTSTHMRFLGLLSHGKSPPSQLSTGIIAWKQGFVDRRQVIFGKISVLLAYWRCGLRRKRFSLPVGFSPGKLQSQAAKKHLIFRCIGNIIFTELNNNDWCSCSAHPRETRGKRETGVNPVRSRHCNRRVLPHDAIAKVRRRGSAMTRKPGNLPLIGTGCCARATRNWPYRTTCRFCGVLVLHFRDFPQTESLFFCRAGIGARFCSSTGFSMSVPYSAENHLCE